MPRSTWLTNGWLMPLQTRPGREWTDRRPRAPRAPRVRWRRTLDRRVVGLQSHFLRLVGSGSGSARTVAAAPLRRRTRPCFDASNASIIASLSTSGRPRAVDAREAQVLERRRGPNRTPPTRATSSSAMSTPNISALSELTVTSTPAARIAAIGWSAMASTMPMRTLRRRAARHRDSPGGDLGHQGAIVDQADAVIDAIDAEHVDARCGCRRPDPPRRGASSSASRGGGPMANGAERTRQGRRRSRRRRRRRRPGYRGRNLRRARAVRSRRPGPDGLSTSMINRQSTPKSVRGVDARPQRDRPRSSGTARPWRSRNVGEKNISR